MRKAAETVGFLTDRTRWPGQGAGGCQRVTYQPLRWHRPWMTWCSEDCALSTSSSASRNCCSARRAYPLSFFPAALAGSSCGLRCAGLHGCLSPGGHTGGLGKCHTKRYPGTTDTWPSCSSCIKTLLGSISSTLAGTVGNPRNKRVIESFNHRPGDYPRIPTSARCWSDFI